MTPGCSPFFTKKMGPEQGMMQVGFEPGIVITVIHKETHHRLGGRGAGWQKKAVLGLPGKRRGWKKEEG
jgi:hypothetical protein